MLASIGYYNRYSPIWDTTIDTRLYGILQSILASDDATVDVRL